MTGFKLNENGVHRGRRFYLGGKHYFYIMVYIRLLIVLLAGFCSLSAISQSDFENNGLTPGLRMGSNYSAWFGFSLRLNTDDLSGEVILTPETDRITLTGLLAIQENMEGSIDGISYFYGLGVHAGIQSNAVPLIGADAIVGVEYDMPSLPLLLSIDIKPALDLFGSDVGFNWNQGAITLRYALGQ